MEGYRIARENSPAGIAERERREAEKARKALEQFITKVRDFLTNNEDEFFQLIKRLHQAQKPKNNYKQSALTNFLLEFSHSVKDGCHGVGRPD